MFIPIVGGIVLLGYHYEVIAVLASGRGRPYPEFDFGRFGEYLVRGVWVFLVSLCAGLLIIPLYLCFLVLGAVAGSIDATLGGVAMIIFFFVLMVVYFCGMLGMIPLTLRAGFTKNFGESFDFAFIKDFVSKMWLEEFLCMLFIGISSWFVMMAGMAMFCIGMYPAIALVGMAYTHLQFQLYQVYLSRGGQPIRIEQ
ncbi:MAG: DUF4013 domain-containing protein [Pirellulales bacterium]